MSADRNLLFGILALQMDFISRDALIAAMHAWVLDKTKPLGQILTEQGHLNPQHQALLEPLVQAHIKAHHNDPQQSLAALSSVSSVRDELAAISDDQLQESLHAVGGAAELSATQQARINSMCNRFEEAWKKAACLGERPAIEDYLAEVTGRERAFLLCELAAVDFDYRRLAGESPSVEEYGVRFASLDTPRLARLLARHGPVDPYATIVKDTPRPGSGLRYRILRPHARGGLGEVFVALDQELHREVALKEIQEERADDALSRSRFLMEAEITGGLEHPGIVPVYGLGQYADGRPFYAMRFIKGDNLMEAIRRFHEAEKPGRDPGERSLALRDLLRRFVDVSNAVAYAHSRGVLHRDLKPGNIMLGMYGETLIVDWGLAKSVGRSDQTRLTEEITLQPISGSDWAATVMGTVIGTPGYMSPEQAAGRLDLLGPASDIYSLGATLYALLTGTAPFDESDQGELLQQVQRGAWLAPRQVKPNTPPALDAICRKAMALQPEDRYTTALALAADVEQWLADEAVTAYREPWSIRTGRWLRRHRPLVAGAVALLLAAVPLSLVIAVQADRDKHEIAGQKDLAQANEKAANEREAETKAVLEFVENRVFAAARPEGYPGGLGRDVTLRRAVEAALPFVAKGFTDQPLIEARLRRTLGTSFSYLGNPVAAAGQYQAARVLYARHRGPDDPDTLASMGNLANSYADLGQYADALKLREETLALQKAKLGPDHPDTLMSMHNLAHSYAALGRYTDALKLREDTLALRRAKLGRDHPDTLMTMHGLANSYTNLGRYADALKLHKETLALQKSRLGPEHPETLKSMNNLANSYQARGRHAEALKLHEETLAIQKAKLGPDHSSTLMSMHNLAMTYTSLGRHTDALKLHEETLALRKAKLGRDHPATLMSMLGLAISYAGLGRHTDALKLYEETLALQKAKLGPDHPDTLKTMHNLAISYGALGRPTDAHKLYKETLALHKAKLGPDHPVTLFCMWGVAESLVNLERGAEAVAIIDDCVQRASGKVVDPRLLPAVMDLRLRHFEKTKDPAGCRQTAAMWEKLNRADADSLYEAAYMRAVTAAVLRAADSSAASAKQADAEDDQAMAWLKKAVAVGYKNAAHMQKDKDLDALRQREDFKKLLGELAAGGAKEK
jgi:serine/threonine protein kinase/tetratricopeptide (TPR) repeat protein